VIVITAARDLAGLAICSQRPRNSSLRHGTAEQVLFAALRMFHNQAAIARMTESLGVSAAVHGPLDFPELLPNRNGLFAPNGLGLAWGRSIRNVINANVSSPCHAAI